MSKNFEKICRMSQEDLKKYAARRLKNTHREVISEDGFVYAKGTFPVLLVAHMDTVHDKLPTFIVHEQNKDVLSSPNGIGGDDRCGVYMIFRIIQKYNCSVLFCEDEEIGAVGADKFTKSIYSYGTEFNYIIEFDRKGNNDAVFYECANDDFEDFITKEFFQTAYGSFSDISVLAPHLGCAAVNLSCGYYNAHTKSEYVVLSEMEEVIINACKILERTTEDDKFEYIEAPRKWRYYGNGNYVGSYGGGWTNYEVDEDDFAENYYIIEYVTERGDTEWYDTMAISKAEAIGLFCQDHPDTCYNDIIDITVTPAYLV